MDDKIVGENALQEAPTLRAAKVRWFGDQIGWVGDIGLSKAASKARTLQSLRAVNREPMHGGLTHGDIEGRRALGFDRHARPLH
eukprot:g6800.t1